jgi:PilZ domain
MNSIPADARPEPSQPTRRVDRAQRYSLQVPLRYRLVGQQDWSTGETINLSESGILFSTENLLEINARLEITFQTTGNPLLSSSTRLAQVVRRVLINWPETRPAFGTRFCS